MWSWYGNVPSFSWQCGNVIISCVSRVLNQVFQYLRRPLLKHQSYQLRDIVQRNFRPACSTHLERSVAWKQLSGDVLVQEFRVLVVTGCEGMASRGSSNRRRDLKKKRTYESGGMHWSWPTYTTYPSIHPPIAKTSFNILEVRKARHPNDLFLFPLAFCLSMYLHDSFHRDTCNWRLTLVPGHRKCWDGRGSSLNANLSK